MYYITAPLLTQQRRIRVQYESILNPSIAVRLLQQNLFHLSIAFTDRSFSRDNIARYSVWLSKNLLGRIFTFATLRIKPYNEIYKTSEQLLH